VWLESVCDTKEKTRATEAWSRTPNGNSTKGKRLGDEYVDTERKERKKEEKA